MTESDYPSATENNTAIATGKEKLDTGRSVGLDPNVRTLSYPIAFEHALDGIPESGPVHNDRALGFGPDRYLYIGVGDCVGSQFDSGPGHAQDWYDSVDGGNEQDITAGLLGSTLRIDVDPRDSDQPYGIPSDYLFVGSSGLDGQYARELRNPYQLSWTGGKLIAGYPHRETGSRTTAVIHRWTHSPEPA